MINVAVCDDDTGSRDQITGYLERYQREHKVSFVVFVYQDGEEFLANYPQDLDVLFLDIKMKSLSGLDIARHIRSFDENLCIIFISNMTQYALEGYQVHAFNFIVKPFTFQRFEKELTLYLAKIPAKHESLMVKNEKGYFSISPNEIYYIETLNHKMLIHGKTGSHVCYVSISALEKKLAGSSFFRCHVSYLINLSYIREIRSDSLLMADESIVPVSRHRKKELLSAVAKHIREIL